jgi:hypothetical protein
VALESRQEYLKERFDVGLMNSFDLNQSQTLLSNAQSDVLRTKYDYIFKILEFYFGIPIIKTNTLCQRNQFTLNRRCSCRYCFINYTFKNRVIGNKDEGKEVETAVVNAITIVETSYW